MENKEKVFLLGGKDAEMKQIKTILEKNNVSYIDKGLCRGAKVEDYADEINQLIADGKQPVAIELTGAGEGEYDNVISIDHHGKRAHEKAAILQVIDALGIEASLEDKLIAANDSGYIPAMKEFLEKEGIVDPLEQKKIIECIRYKDRQAQGITEEQEEQAKEAIKSKESLVDGKLTVVHMPHSKSATVTDRLFGSYKNLLVLSSDGEVNMFGDGKLCEELKTKFEGRNGGSGLGIEGGNAFRGGYPNHEEVQKFVIEYLERKENIGECKKELSNAGQKKLLTNKDLNKMIGEKVRVKRQYLITRHRWHIEEGETTYIKFKKSTYGSDVEKISQEKSRPSIGGDQTELSNILKERGYCVVYEGRSGFAARNSYVVSKITPKTQKISAPLIIHGGLEEEEKKELGLDPTRSSGDEYTVWTGKNFEGEVILDSEIDEVIQIIEKAKEELKNRKQREIIQLIESVKQGNISIIRVGGDEKFSSEYDVPKKYKVIVQKKIANTQDHRQHRNHTYELLLLDMESIQGKQIIELNIPDAYKGLVIGKGGSNIKKLSEELGCKIKII